MKYKVGDKVRVKSLDWYNENKDINGYVNTYCTFTPQMAKYCGKETTIENVLVSGSNRYMLDGIPYYTFSDDMFELVKDTNTVLEIPGGYEVDRIESDKIYLKKQEVTTYDTLPQTKGYNIYQMYRSEKEAKSAIAMARISQLIPYYGGAITNEEWYDENMPKYCIERRFDSIRKITIYGTYTFLAFRTKEQRDRFMSYTENVQLVKDYLMID